jgi:hypothetical protein
LLEWEFNQQFSVNGKGDMAISVDRAVGRAFARHKCRAKARPTKHFSVHRELLGFNFIKLVNNLLLIKDKDKE